MGKYILTFFVVAFIFSLFILNINSTDAQSTLPNCSSISGYRLIMGGSCTVLVNTNAVFNFKARDPDGGNLSWSINWGDGQSAPKFCPAFYPNTTFSVGHAWTTAGTYNVKLGVSNCKVDGDSAASFSVVVKSPIVISTPTPTPTPTNTNTKANTYDFDMIVEKIGIWPTTALQGQPISLNAKLRNLGTQNDPKFSWLYSGYNKDPKKPGHGPICLYRTDSTGNSERQCPAGPSVFPLEDKPICGNNYYVLKVDAYDDVLETNENNNEVSGDVFVDCSKKPDFIIEKIGTWPTTIKDGTKPLIYFVEKNIGQGIAGRAGVVRMTVNNQYRGGIWSFQSSPPGSSTGSMTFGYWYSGAQIDPYWTVNCQPGEKLTLKVCADNACGWGASEIDESDENNNILTHEVTCQ